MSYSLSLPSYSVGVDCYKEIPHFARYYGKTPCDIDPDFRKKICGDEKIIDCRPADLLKPELDTFRNEIAEYYEQEEDVLSYAQFGDVAIKFFQKRRDKKYGLDGKHDNMGTKVHPV